MYAQTLIEKARASGQWPSDAAIAEAIGVDRSLLNRVSKGKQKMPPERAALLADLIGEDAGYALQRVAMENAEPDLLTRLQKAFRVAAGVAGAVVLAAMATAPSPTSAGTIKMAPDAVQSTRPDALHALYIVALLRRLKAALTARRSRYRMSPLMPASIGLRCINRCAA